MDTMSMGGRARKMVRTNWALWVVAILLTFATAGALGVWAANLDNRGVTDIPRESLKPGVIEGWRGVAGAGAEYNSGAARAALESAKPVVVEGWRGVAGAGAEYNSGVTNIPRESLKPGVIEGWRGVAGAGAEYNSGATDTPR